MPSPYIRFEMKVNGQDLRMEESRLLNFLYYHSIRGSAQYYVYCTAKKWNYYDQLYEPGTEVQIRFGRKDGSTSLWSPTHTMLVGEVEAHYHPQCVFVNVTGMDKGVKLFERCSQKVWKDKKISEIVTELAGESELDTQVESTKGKFNLTQALMPDGHYIQKVLLPLAYNASRQDYLCYIKEGKTLVFEPPDVGSSQATLKYPGVEGGYGPIEPPIIHFRPIRLPANGAWSDECRAVNPFKKKGEFFKADDGSVQLKKLASQTPSPPDNPARLCHTIYSEKDTLENVTKAEWSRRARELWIVDTKTIISPGIEIGKAIKLEMTSDDGESHFASGKYLVAGMMHWIDTMAQRSYTRLWLMRRSK